MSGDYLNLRRVDSGEEMLRCDWLDLKRAVVEVALRDLTAKFPDRAARRLERRRPRR